MLALETGWTPDVIAELPASFRDAAHWALYARAICGPEGLPSTDLPAGTRRTPEMAKAAIALKAVRDGLFPEGD